MYNIYKLTKTKKVHNPLINIKFTLLEIEEQINDEYLNLVEYKNKIEYLDNQQLWDTGKKISNNYELIYLPNKKYIEPLYIVKGNKPAPISLFNY